MSQPRLSVLLHHGALVLLFAFSSALTGCRAISGPEREIDGTRSFVRHCARCHGADGKGNPKMQPIPNFQDPSWQASRSDQQILRAIQMGQPPRMPAFGRRFMAPTQASLVAAIRKLAQPAPGSGSSPASPSK